MAYFDDIWRLFSEIRQMPRVSVDLMYSATANNDPFFEQMVRRHYREARSRHSRYWIIRRMVHGVAICQLPATFDEYYMQIEAAARRNHKKALREGCVVRRFEFNAELNAIRDIRLSADERQGRKMPDEYRQGIVRPSFNPRSRNSIHDYPHYGVFLKDQLVAYAGCMIAGEVCCLEHILGHADYLPLGIVPQLIIEIGRDLFVTYPQVRYYAYGMYFGAGETLQRFKRKFDFLPHRVDWLLERENSILQKSTLASLREVHAT